MSRKANIKSSLFAISRITRRALGLWLFAPISGGFNSVLFEVYKFKRPAATLAILEY
jgi:hypothetical protein